MTLWNISNFAIKSCGSTRVLQSRSQGFSLTNPPIFLGKSPGEKIASFEHFVILLPSVIARSVDYETLGCLFLLHMPEYWSPRSNLLAFQHQLSCILIFLIRWKENSEQRRDQGNSLGDMDMCFRCRGEWYLGEVHRYKWRQCLWCKLPEWGFSHWWWLWSCKAFQISLSEER